MNMTIPIKLTNIHTVMIWNEEYGFYSDNSLANMYNGKIAGVKPIKIMSAIVAVHNVWCG